MTDDTNPANDPGPAPGDVPQCIADALAGGPEAFLDGFTETGDGPRSYTPEELRALEMLEEQLIRNARRARP